ncbi:M23 family metallopeptidase [Curtobacterium oceanosedimentum]|uniref:M23 family metallopeptidase n=1 Tax=Curtobacterium oceanosedimentum TaxID=465820 RepID=UPI00192A0B94|nr:M23 family metallopeptidase [Curtobacterium oceanosedimentum]
MTASALAACLVVSGATPAAALDDPTRLGLGAARTAAPTPASHVAPLPEQHYRVASGVSVTVTRDGFDVRQTRAGGARPGGVQITTGAGAVRPVAGTIPTAGGFGGRQVAGCGACSTNHHGLDFAAAAGTPVVAVMPGRVVSAGPLGGYGNQVLLAHPDGTQTRYGHLSRIDVLPGQTLSAGEQVGAVGSTGISTGPHLHFEVIIGGTPVDPSPWLAARGLL